VITQYASRSEFFFLSLSKATENKR